MDQREIIELTREKIISTISQNMHMYGIAPSIGRLYGTMFFHQAPMTLDEMRDSLEMSKTSMSTSIRALLEIKMVHKIWKKGERKDLYSVEDDWYKTFINLFSTKWSKGIQLNEEEILRAKDTLSKLIDQTEDESLQQMIRSDILKLEHAMEYYDWLNRLVESFETGEIFELIPKTAPDKNKNLPEP